MLSTTWTWTQEWSDIPSRVELSWAMYHQARTRSSELTASRNFSSLRLPRVGAWTLASATASAGVRLACRALRRSARTVESQRPVFLCLFLAILDLGRAARRCG